MLFQQCCFCLPVIKQWISLLYIGNVSKSDIRIDLHHLPCLPNWSSFLEIDVLGFSKCRLAYLKSLVNWIFNTRKEYRYLVGMLRHHGNDKLNAEIHLSLCILKSFYPSDLLSSLGTNKVEDSFSSSVSIFYWWQMLIIMFIFCSAFSHKWTLSSMAICHIFCKINW